MDQLVGILLAAGKGTRMKSDLAKVLHPLAGLPMLAYPLRAARQAGCTKVIIVVGHQKEKIKAAFSGPGISFVYQREQLGSGHAVAVTAQQLAGFRGEVLILCADVPLITAETLQRFVAAHREADATLSVLSVVLDDPAGYGRIMRDRSGMLAGIVEERDAGAAQRAIREVNTGIYCCRAPFLCEAVANIGRDNDQQEYYLPDIIGIAVQAGRKAQAIALADAQEVRGINDRIGLAGAEKLIRRRILASLMAGGVTILDPECTYIDEGVSIGADSIIYPNTFITRGSSLGARCVVEQGCTVSGTQIGKNVHLRPGCVIDSSRIRDDACIGPFAHIRNGAEITQGAVIGNFVEVKNSRIGPGTKACHLSYLGDASIGAGVNIGAGTITCNFDGTTKHPTTIADKAFIGSNTALVAPVAVGEQAVIGAGSTITRDVPAGAVSIARARQVNRAGRSSAGRSSKQKRTP